MFPKPGVSSLLPLGDAELEWLLCLTATFQACEHQIVSFADEGRQPSHATFLAGVRACLERKRNRAERVGAA